MRVFTPEQAGSFLQRHVALFNAGVRARDFSAFVKSFRDDAVLDVEGVPGGPIVGRDAIAARYRDEAPDDEIIVRRWKYGNGKIVAEFYWRDIQEAPGGCFVIVPREEKIASLTVAFGGPDKCW